MGADACPAFPAFAPAALADEEVLTDQGVTIDAARLPTASSATFQIDRLCDGFEMRRIAAETPPAEVIQHQAVRDRPNEQGVGQAVHPPCGPLVSNSSIIAALFEPAASPDPAWSWDGAAPGLLEADFPTDPQR